MGYVGSIYRQLRLLGCTSCHRLDMLVHRPPAILPTILERCLSLAAQFVALVPLMFVVCLRSLFANFLALLAHRLEIVHSLLGYHRQRIDRSERYRSCKVQIG